MKKLLAGAVAVTISTPAFAGGYADPEIEFVVPAPVVVEETAASSSAQSIVIPLLLLAIVAAAAAN